MQSPVWSPVFFCHPSHFLEALDPHWGPEFSDITPKALAQPRSCPPHRQMPSQDSLGHHLPLPVPVGAATPGACIYFGSFFARRGREERFSRRETEDREPGGGCSRWPWPISSIWPPAFGDLPQRPLSPGFSWCPAEGTGLGPLLAVPSVLLSWTRPLLLPRQSPLRHLRFGTRADQDEPCPVDFLHLFKLPQEG